MAYTVGTCMNVKKMLPRSSSPVLTTQGASSRVLKGTAGNITVYLYIVSILNAQFNGNNFMFYYVNDST